MLCVEVKFDGEETAGVLPEVLLPGDDIGDGLVCELDEAEVPLLVEEGVELFPELVGTDEVA